MIANIAAAVAVARKSLRKDSKNKKKKSKKDLTTNITNVREPISTLKHIKDIFRNL